MLELQVEASGIPVIVRFGPQPGENAIANYSFDPGVYNRDPWVAAFRMEINSLSLLESSLRLSARSFPLTAVKSVEARETSCLCTISSQMPLNMFETTGMARGLGGMFLRVYLPVLRGHEAFEGIDKWRKRRKEAQERQELAHRNLENLPQISYYIALALAIGQVTWAQKLDENMFCDLVSCPTCNLRFSAGRVETPRSKPEIEVHGRRRDYRSGDLGKIVPMSRAVMGEIREIPPSLGDGNGNGDDDKGS
ncbi:hypothetical protein HDU90_008567 [Geranomyces variabilis]|nr:hypothetical protein HDU90_008567 [Geranomyces variabilis]